MDLAQIYTTPAGHLRRPFADMDLFLTRRGQGFRRNEICAVENMHQFLSSVAILCQRLRKNLLQFKPESWTGVNFSELFLDTQSLFLFVEQFLLDLTVVVRLSLDHKAQRGVGANFNSLEQKLTQSLPAGHPLLLFLKKHGKHFRELKDIRDDICHRMAHMKQGSIGFPDFGTFIRRAGGRKPFASGQDLRDYLSQSLRKVMSLACLLDDYATENFRRMHPGVPHPLSGAFIVPKGAKEVSEAGEPAPTTMVMSREGYEALVFFLEGHPDNLKLRSRPA